MSDRGHGTTHAGPSEIVAAIATERERRTYGRCIYCSTPCYGLCCQGHRDLLTLDPHQYEMRLRAINEKGQR